MGAARELLKTSNFYRKLHGSLTLIWLAMIPISLFTGLKSSLPFIVFISVYANVGNHWGAWQGARAESAGERGKVRRDDS